MEKKEENEGMPFLGIITGCHLTNRELRDLLGRKMKGAGYSCDPHFLDEVVVAVIVQSP